MRAVELEKISRVTQGATLARFRTSDEEAGEDVAVIQTSNLGALYVTGELEQERLVAEKIEQYRVKPGNVLIALRGTPLRASVVPDDSRIVGAVAGPNVALIALDDDAEIDAPYLAGLLSSDMMNLQLIRLTSGSAVPTLSVKNLRTVEIPIFDPPEKRARLSEAFRAQHDYEQRSRELLTLHKERLEAMLIRLGTESLEGVEV